jgi:hypothetical protein
MVLTTILPNHNDYDYDGNDNQTANLLKSTTGEVTDRSSTMIFSSI